ncbi:hypothetical protein GCM10011391_12580 [Pullulanibacillus camelliae]|uniref:Type III-B CRISPR module-associated protein Cmr3 n=1 Tax=Pullulanibacillus camelliae TaxID=1707096 RepID=A0A8J2VNC6_9BACL|nr:type III-B CRISPR module-associated Cmr3 family protein [Pullulanibacillus camelliae]GGE35340.1 hypothetical protein GCM10011391_12580 [Pullulanibacillus camelliae]
MYYRITAVDSWFFRDSAPYDAGVNTNGKSLFPPFPSVYAGALRSCATPISRSAGKNTFSRRLKIGWSGVIADGHFLFPLPLDLSIHSTSNTRASEMRLGEAKGSSFPLKYFLEADKQEQDKGKPPHIYGGAFLENTSMDAYINAEDKRYPYQALGDYFTEETRVGIRLDPSLGRAVEGQMYQQTFVYPRREGRSCSLALEATGIDVPQGSTVRLGGEGKLGVIECVSNAPKIPDAPVMNGEKYFKLYLATPAIFEKGWLPGWIHTENMTGTFTHKKRRVRVKLVSAAVGNHVPVGGFGSVGIGQKSDGNYGQKPYPKELRYAVPGGSVYFFELLEGSMADVIRLFHQKCISDYRETLGFRYETRDRLRYCSRGFGYSLVGKVSKNQGGILYVH